MSTLFEKIIDGEIPGQIVWQDPVCVAFLSVDPLTDGHTLVVPRTPVDQWLDADDDLVATLMSVGKVIGRAQVQEWGARRAGVLIEGFQVPHLHVHVWPANGHGDFDVNAVTHGQDPQVLATNADRLRARLRTLGYGEQVPA
ncbi:HIT family protein [Allobranchiibius sp. GilTou38]|uniref:HIT domain-containing protein n=1 Tax=Allobranchiibius sp. GilTou38 TaxID=2815210 RepID=UPI001AA0B8C1|nr:HIT family protein [Allobranchiibius sp. GilTou38]